VTAIFFWAFIIIVFFVLFNMVLAVVFSVYEDQQALASHKGRDEGESKKTK
jgi:predicted membrane protein